LALLLIPALQPLLHDEPTCGYDNVFHLWRAVQVDHLLDQGILFSRWAPDMAHGYGYPLFVVMPTGSTYVFTLMHRLGLGWSTALNATFALGLVLGSLFTFLLARELFGGIGGLVATAAYAYAPYQAYEIFNRGSLSEAFAWAFPPLILWALHRWTRSGERRFLALGSLGLAALIVTHQVFAFLFTPLLVGWVLLNAHLSESRGTVIRRGAVLGLLGLGLCAFFWLPALAERPWMQAESLLGNWVFDYRNNFLRLQDLFALPRGVDPALINDWPPKALGLIPVAAALATLLRWRAMDRETRGQVALLLALTAGFSWMTLPPSLPLWDHLPLLPYVQFPWRFLGPAALCTALLIGATAATLSGRRATLWAGLMLPLLILGHLGWFYPDHCEAPDKISIPRMIHWERVTDTLGTTARGEYLPRWVQRVPEHGPLADEYREAGPIARLAVDSLPAGARVLRARYGPLGGTIELDSPVSFRARYLAFYYPGWRATIDDRVVPITPTDPEGLISFAVPAGRHTIRVRFGSTPLRLTAGGASLLSALLLLGALTLPPSRWPRPTHHDAALAALTLAFLIALALNVSPYLRGPEQWRWAYAHPGRLDRLWIPALTLVAYIGLSLLWIAGAERGRRRRWLLLLLVLAVPAIQLSLLSAEGGDPWRPLFYRTISAGASGVFSVGSTIEQPGEFLRRYPELMPTFPVHPQRYPPGLPLVFYGARQMFERLPALADVLGFRLRLYQCRDLALMRLSNATLASASVQMALPLLSGLTLLPLYGLARRAYDERVATWAVALYPLVPAFALWAGRWEQFYPLLAVTTWYLFHIGLTERRRWALGAAGLTLAVGSALNFSLLALGLPLGIWAALWLLTHWETVRGRYWALIWDGLAFLTGLAAPWVVYRLLFGTGLLEIWRVSMGYHLGLDRDYGTWLFYHLYDFLTFLGIPLALLFLFAWIRAVRETHQGSWDQLTLAFAAGLVLLNLSGTARGEVARVWLFLTPFATLAAARGLHALPAGGRRARATVLLSLLALQLLTFNTFLRVVTTGVTPPPTRTRTFALPAAATPLDVRFGEAIALRGYDFEGASVRPGGTLTLTLHWQALKPVAEPYTVFIHLRNEGGELIAQQDNMPLRGSAPTTCWVPGEILSDRYVLHVDPQTPPGRYLLSAGLYHWPEGQRLAAHGLGARPDHSVLLTPVDVVEE
jgi:hypothetical protein